MKATLKSKYNTFEYKGNGIIAFNSTSSEDLHDEYTVEFSGMTSDACRLNQKTVTLYVYSDVGGVITANTQTAQTITEEENVCYRAEFKFKEDTYVEITSPCLADETPSQTPHLEARLNGTTWIEDGSTVSFGCSAITEDDQQYIQLRAYNAYEPYKTYEQGHTAITMPAVSTGVYSYQVVTQHEASTAYTDDVITADYVYNEYRDKFDITPSNGNAKANIEEATKFYFKPNSITANTRTNQLCFHSQDLGCPQFDIMVEHIGLTEEGVTPTRCELRNTALTLSYDASPIASNDTFAKATVSGEENIELWYIYDFGKGVTYETQVSLGDGDVHKAWSYQGTKVADDASINSTTGQINCSSNISDEQRVLYRNVTYTLTITTTYLASSITSNTVETVEQSNDLIELTITPQFYTFDHTGGTLTYQINSTRNGEPYPWHINFDDTKYVDWISFTPSTGVGASTITVTCDANTDITSESTRDTALRLHQENRSTVVYTSISQEPAPSYIYDIFVDNDTIAYGDGDSTTEATVVNVTSRRGIGTTYESVTTWESQDWVIDDINGENYEQLTVVKSGNQLLITPKYLVDFEVQIWLKVEGVASVTGEERETKQGYCSINVSHSQSMMVLTFSEQRQNWPDDVPQVYITEGTDSCSGWTNASKTEEVVGAILNFDDDCENENSAFPINGTDDNFIRLNRDAAQTASFAKINVAFSPELSGYFNMKLEYQDKDGVTHTVVADPSEGKSEESDTNMLRFVGTQGQGWSTSDEFIAFCSSNPIGRVRLYGIWFNIWAHPHIMADDE